MLSCKVEGCEDPVRCRELCRKHYARWLRHGDPLGGKNIFRDDPQLLTSGKKTCRSCCKIRDLTDFRDDQRSYDGYAHWCRPCQTSDRRDRRQADPEAARAVEREHYRKTRDRHADLKFRATYGITKAERDEIEERQCGQCASCGKPPSGKGHTKKLFVDHCHSSGRVRGLLCHPCNVALGLLRDDPAVIQALLRYAERGESDPATG